MQEFERASFHKEYFNEEINTGSYVFEPLERGFGTTIGNTICSTLLTNLPGTAVIGFHINGIDSKVLSANGILEDLNQIALNLKTIQIDSDIDDVTVLHISKKGPAMIQSADLICPENVEILDPDQVICNLEKGADLEMDVYIAKSTGYESAEDNQANFKLGDEVFVMDAMFTPIRKATYTQEPARIGFDKKYDKVHIEVKTDGTITPLQAISDAAQVCIDYLDAIIPISDLELEESFLVQQPEVEEAKKVNTMMIEDLDLSVRSYNCLKRAGIQTVDELTQKSEDEMMHVKNLGKKSLKEVKDKMYQLGLYFKSYDGQ